MDWSEYIMIGANSDNLASNKALRNVGFEEKYLSYYGIRFPIIPKIRIPIFPTITWKNFH